MVTSLSLHGQTDTRKLFRQLKKKPHKHNRSQVHSCEPLHLSSRPLTQIQLLFQKVQQDDDERENHGRDGQRDRIIHFSATKFATPSRPFRANVVPEQLLIYLRIQRRLEAHLRTGYTIK